MKNYRGIGWRCAVLRQRAGLDQAEAAKKAGIALRTWRNVETGKPCRFWTVLAIGRVFGVCHMQLWYGEHEPGEAWKIMLKERQS